MIYLNFNEDLNMCENILNLITWLDFYNRFLSWCLIGIESLIKKQETIALFNSLKINLLIILTQ